MLLVHDPGYAGLDQLHCLLPADARRDDENLALEADPVGRFDELQTASGA